jgi:hypothetical protein
LKVADGDDDSDWFSRAAQGGEGHDIKRMNDRYCSACFLPVDAT